MLVECRKQFIAMIIASLFNLTIRKYCPIWRTLIWSGISVPFTNLAVLYMQQGNYRLAISCCNEVLRINPMATDGLVTRGITYVQSGKVNVAMQDYTRAIAISPTTADAHELLASAYMMSDNFEAAIRSYRQALMLDPDFPRAACNLFYSLQCVCDWDKREEMFIEDEEILRRQIEMSIIPSFQPFQAIAYPLDSMLALDIRYVSSDFRNHSVSHLMGSVFGMHDSENFEVFCYTLSPNDGTEWGIRIQYEAEHFIEKTAMCYIQTANQSGLIMDCLRINSYLHVLTSLTRWILRFLLHGAISLSVYQKVFFGFLDFQLQGRRGSAHA